MNYHYIRGRVWIVLGRVDDVKDKGLQLKNTKSSPPSKVSLDVCDNTHNNPLATYLRR